MLYKKPILVERASFRPATKLTLDLLERALEQFLQEPAVRGQTPVVLAEMTLRSLNPGNDAGHDDFLARADILRALGFDVLISRFEPYYELAEYLAGYTDGLIGVVVGCRRCGRWLTKSITRTCPAASSNQTTLVQTLRENIRLSDPQSGHRPDPDSGERPNAATAAPICTTC